MTSGIIIAITGLLLVAYLFDLSSARTRIPAVILLLATGWAVRRFTDWFHLSIPDLQPLLPVFGTVGLILIVLEGSLELEFNRGKAPLIKKSLLASTLPLFALAFLMAWVFQYFHPGPFKDHLTNAIPLCVISSSIAIPSVKALSRFNREFVVYESSLSDIVGVLFFNFVALNDNLGFHSLGEFLLQLLVMILISFVATLLLGFMLHRIDHHIKFAPIILLVILIYTIAKVYHLPSLLFILLFGLFMGNLDELKNVKWIQKLRPAELNEEVKKFKELTIEGAFLIRALFFLLFGFLIETKEILNQESFLWSVGIVIAIFSLRAIQLKTLKLPFSPLLFIAPRGLITILLFLSIAPSASIPLVNRSLIIQVIILTALVMMAGLITNKRIPEEALKENNSQTTT
jgi:hypothetical protein